MAGENLKAVLETRVRPEGMYTAANRWIPSAQGELYGLDNKPIPESASPYFKNIREMRVHPAFDGDPRIATEAQIQAAGFKVKAGETGVLAYKVGKTIKDYELLKEALSEKKINQEKYDQEHDALFDTYYNGTQIERDTRNFQQHSNDFKTALTAEQRQQLTQLENMAAAIGVQIKHFGVMPAHLKDEDIILMPTKDQFHSPEGYMQALGHELIHATRNKAPQFSEAHIPPRTELGDYHYAQEEWRAELGSAVLLERLGVPLDVANSARYIDFWSMGAENNQLVSLSVKDRDTKIVQSITAANFLLEKAGLTPLPISPEALQTLKAINQAYPRLPASSLGQGGEGITNPNAPMRQFRDEPLATPENSLHPYLQKLDQAIRPTLTRQITAHGNAAFTEPLIAATLQACAKARVNPDTINHLAYNQKTNNILVHDADKVVANGGLGHFAVVPIEAAKQVDPQETLREAERVLTQQQEQARQQEQQKLEPHTAGLSR